MRMKKWRRVLSLFLVVALIVGLAPAQTSLVLPVKAASDTPTTGALTGKCGDNITWTLTEDTSEWDLLGTHYTLTLTGSGLMTDYTYYNSVPWYLYRSKITSISIDARITSIGSYAFSECVSLESVKIPDKVTSIGNYAFYRNYKLKTIIFGSGLKTIGDYAFSYCNDALTEVSFKSGLLTVGEDAFSSCTQLKTVNLPSTVTEIKRGAFRYCRKLSTAPLPANLKTLGDYCFYNASSLTTITIPKTLTSIGLQCFFGSTALTEIKVTSGNATFSVQNNVLYQKEGTQYIAVVYAVGAPTTQLTLKAGTVKIGEGCFAYAYSLADITLPSSVTTIGDSAFYYSRITTVNFTAPAKVTLIQASAFYGCSSLTSITLPDTLTSIGSWGFNSSGLREINTNNVESIGSNAFGACNYLETVTIGSALKSLSGKVFERSSRLNTITVSDENPYLDDIDNVVFNKNHTKLCFYAFAKAGALYQVPDTVEQIEAYSIYSVPSLKELYLPQAVNNISSYGIWNNTKLKSIYFKGNAPTIANGSTNATNPVSSFSISGNAANLLVYKTETSSGWEDAKWSSYVFADYYPESEVSAEGTVGAIQWTYEGTNGRIKFSRTTGESAITQLPDFVGDSPAPWNQYMNQIQTVEAEGINGIGDYNFQGAEKLIRLEADERLVKIGEYGFENCKKLLFIDIASVERIGACAFKNNARITGAVTGFLTLDKVVTIGSEAFRGCTSITKATLGSQLTSLEAGVFADCTQLSNFTIPESVTAIKKQALSGCTKLRTINIPANVKLIGESAFANNTTLEKVYFKGVALQGEEWANDSFANCNENLILYYEKDQTSWVVFGGQWNGLPLQGIGHYTQQRDHYSFANTRDSFGYAQDYRVPRQRFVDVIGSIISGTYYYSVNRQWNGSCFGMASTTLEFYENINEDSKFLLTKYGGDVETLYQIGAPGNEKSALTKVIEAYQLSQYKSFMSSCSGAVSRHMRDYKGLYDKVEEFERSGGLAVDSQAEPVVMLIYSAYSGHAVVPISVDQNSNGDFIFQVYDPNIPSEVQTITMKKDYSGIYYNPSYICKPFTYASYIGYTDIAQNMSNIELHGVDEDQSIYLSINKEDGEVTNSSGDGVDKIKGAYEQKFFGTENEGEFSGIKSFVLPQGAVYQIASQESDHTQKSDSSGENTTDTTKGSVSFYMASDESFAEVNSSDENAVLQVNDDTTAEGQMEIALQSESEGEENAVIMLMNPQGMERTVEVEGSNATITTESNNTITVEVPAGEAVKIDGKKVETVDGKVVSSFEANADENPLVADDLETSIFCNEENKLQGSVDAAVISRIGDAKDVTVTATYFDQNDTKVASYSEVKTLQSGLNFISLSFDELSADFGGMDFEEIGSELKLSCLLTVKDEENHFVSAIASGLKVSPTITPEPDEPEPDNPNPDEPGPDNPNPDEPGPDNPNPDEPGPDNPNPDNPEPDNPEPDKPDKPEPDPGTDTEIAVTSVETAKKALTLNVGESYQAIVTVLPSNATDKKLSFKASNENVVVTEEGKITAKKAGTCVVKVAASNGISTTIAVTIKDVPKKPSTNINQNTVNKSVAVASVKVSKKKLVLGKGETYQIKATVAPKNATNKKLIYRTANKKVSVNAKGLIKAKKTGTSKVTIIASNGKKAVITVVVKKAPKKLKLNAVKKTLKVGKTYKIKAKLQKGTASYKLTYSSNKKSVAKVSSAGKVTAKKKGTAIITVKTFNKKKAKIKIIVK